MIKTRKIKRIFVKNPQNIKKMMSEFHCSKATIYNALSYKTNSVQSEEIRNAALNKYCGIVLCETKV